MKKIILLTFIFFQFNQLYSQEIQTEIQGKKIGYFIDIEKKLKSELFDTNQTYMSLDDSAQPIIFKRKEKNIPDLLVEYKFSKKDSIINDILYEWDVYNFDKSDNNIKSEKFNKSLVEKYNELLKILSSKYGKSETEGNLNDLSKANDSEGLNRKDIWKPNENLEIVMYTAISNYYKKEGYVTVNPTHRIRLYITNIKKKEEPKLDEKTISLANDNFENFIKKMKENNFASAKLFLSDLIVKNVTESQLSELSKNINFDSKLVKYYTGFQIQMTGQNYLMIQYKYENEQSEIPKSIIKAIFDEENKIIGIQPLKKE